MVKLLWVYIKEHELQDPKNKRKILLDDKLATIFKPPLDMFKMNKQLSKHVYTEGAVSLLCLQACKLQFDALLPYHLLPYHLNQQGKTWPS